MWLWLSTLIEMESKVSGFIWDFWSYGNGINWAKRKRKKEKKVQWVEDEGFRPISSKACNDVSVMICLSGKEEQRRKKENENEKERILNSMVI